MYFPSSTDSKMMLIEIFSFAVFRLCEVQLELCIAQRLCAPKDALQPESAGSA